jgi:hypothetical protein
MPWEWYVLGCCAVKNVPFRVLSEQQLDFDFTVVKFPDNILETRMPSEKWRSMEVSMTTTAFLIVPIWAQCP